MDTLLSLGLLGGLCASSGPAPAPQPGPDLGVECAMRSVAFDMAQRHPMARRHADLIHESLQLGKCPGRAAAVTAAAEPAHCPDGRHWSTCLGPKQRQQFQPGAAATVFVDCASGSDSNPGTQAQPLATVARAQVTSRAAGTGTTVFLRGGSCYLATPLVLTAADSGISYESYQGEQVTLSAGAPLTGLSWSPWTAAAAGPGTGKILMAELPATVNASAIDSLFSVPVGTGGGGGGAASNLAKRRVRARYPNGNSEVDRMPDNYDKLAGGKGQRRTWEAAGAKSQRFPSVVRNSSFYPWFGHSNDIRWVLDYHTENASSYYEPPVSFWQSSVGTGAKYNQTSFSQNVDTWTNVADAIVHVIHYDWWGNWQWRLSDVDPESQMMSFAEGGWQDAHGGPVARNYFFIENVLQELDTEGEWYVDRHSRKIYYWPPADAGDGGSNQEQLVVSQLPTVVRIEGGGDGAKATDIRMSGITFAHTQTMFLRQKYSVPSAGDWSVLSRGAVELASGCKHVELRGCTWAQVGGNGLSVFGDVKDAIIADGDFLKTGDSGVVMVGRLPAAAPYDGTAKGAEFPQNVTIERCHFGQIGVFGKQTSALFIAVSKRINFLDNVLYDGPRAGININDGFGGGHNLMRNVIFNQLLESGDHGPINTWSRTAYVQPTGDSAQDDPADPSTRLIQEWTNIDNNFVMVGPKFGSLYGPGEGACSNGVSERRCPKKGGSMFTCLDHDDGSDYYLDTRNVCVFAGMKNYIGQNKIWDSNLIAYPDGALSQNRSGMPCVWT
jgi:hypothetical protein